MHETRLTSFSIYTEQTHGLYSQVLSKVRELAFAVTSPNLSLSLSPQMTSNISFLTVAVTIVSLLVCPANAQLSPNFYGRTCPNVQGIVRNVMTQAVRREARIGASILRMFFHDCFVNVGNQISFLSFLSVGSSNNIFRCIFFLSEAKPDFLVIEDILRRVNLEKLKFRVNCNPYC